MKRMRMMRNITMLRFILAWFGEMRRMWGRCGALGGRFSRLPRVSRRRSRDKKKQNVQMCLLG